MRYYSDELKKFFATEEECKTAEADAVAEKEKYEKELEDLKKQLEKAAANVDKKRKEIETKKAELDVLLKERAKIMEKISDKRLSKYTEEPARCPLTGAKKKVGKPGTKSYTGTFTMPSARDFGYNDRSFDQLGELIDQIFDRRFERRDK